MLDALIRDRHHVDALVRTSRPPRNCRRGERSRCAAISSSPLTWLDAAASADGIVHAAAESGPRARQLDDVVVTTLTSLPARADRFIIYTSGIWVLGTRAARPTSARRSIRPSSWPGVPRTSSACWTPPRRACAPSSSGPASSTAARAASSATCCRTRANSLVRVIGTGDNHWPLVYDRDLGELYARLVGNPTASGVFHANDEGDETVNDIVAALVEHATIRPSVRHVPIAEARKKMGPYADALALDQIVRSPRARRWAGTRRCIPSPGNAARLFEEWRRSERQPESGRVRRCRQEER